MIPGRIIACLNSSISLATPTGLDGVRKKRKEKIEGEESNFKVKWERMGGLRRC